MFRPQGSLCAFGTQSTDLYGRSWKETITWDWWSSGRQNSYVAEGVPSVMWVWFSGKVFHSPSLLWTISGLKHIYHIWHIGLSGQDLFLTTLNEKNTTSSAQKKNYSVTTGWLRTLTLQMDRQLKVDKNRALNAPVKITTRIMLNIEYSHWLPSFKTNTGIADRCRGRHTY